MYVPEGSEGTSSHKIRRPGAVFMGERKAGSGGVILSLISLRLLFLHAMCAVWIALPEESLELSLVLHPVCLVSVLCSPLEHISQQDLGKPPLGAQSEGQEVGTEHCRVEIIALPGTLSVQFLDAQRLGAIGSQGTSRDSSVAGSPRGPIPSCPAVGAPPGTHGSGSGCYLAGTWLRWGGGSHVGGLCSLPG